MDIHRIEAVLEVIEGVKGRDYVKFFRHNVSARLFAAAIDDKATADAFAVFIAGLLSDLAALYKVDISDEDVVDELMRNIDALELER